MSELRIVAGEWRGRRIAVPPGTVRPTSDRVREAWMSIINPFLDGARVLDLCAGSGALGLEALSRGAVHCDFVERDPKILTTLRRNITTLGAEGRSMVHKSEAERFVGDADRGAPRWDVAFSDPPYQSGVARALAELWLQRPFATIFGVEHEAATALPDVVPGGTVDRRVYGGTAITILRTDS